MNNDMGPGQHLPRAAICSTLRSAAIFAPAKSKGGARCIASGEGLSPHVVAEKAGLIVIFSGC